MTFVFQNTAKLTEATGDNNTKNLGCELHHNVTMAIRIKDCLRSVIWAYQFWWILSGCCPTSTINHLVILEDTVRIRQNSRDPRNPPTIVVHSWEER